MLSYGVSFITDLKEKDTTSEAAVVNKGAAMTASFHKIPINILAVSSKTEPARVMKHADELYVGGRSRNRHNILIPSSLQTNVTAGNPYNELLEHNYEYDHPIWMTKKLATYKIQEPAHIKQKLASSIESRFLAAGAIMQLRVIEFALQTVGLPNWKRRVLPKYGPSR